MIQCTDCLIIIQDEDLDPDGACPVCHKAEWLREMCPGDHICTCADTNSYLETTCPVCGARTCPCGAHDVEIISRITGYMSATSGWNQAKQQEFLDRKRYDVGVTR